MRWGWDRNPRTAAPEAARLQLLYICVPHRRPRAPACVGNPLPPQGADPERCYKEPHPAKQTMQLESSRAHRPRSSLRPSPPPQTLPSPPHITGCRLCPRWIGAQPSASGFWEARGRNLSELQGRGGSPSGGDSLSRVRAATVTGFWCHRVPRPK